jgi:cytochrome b involved in lipid metabolism
MEVAGQDATKVFKEANHSMDAIQTSEKYVIGEVEKSSSSLFIVLAIIVALLALYVLFLN